MVRVMKRAKKGGKTSRNAKMKEVDIYTDQEPNLSIFKKR